MRVLNIILNLKKYIILLPTDVSRIKLMIKEMINYIVKALFILLLLGYIAQLFIVILSLHNQNTSFDAPSLIGRLYSRDKFQFNVSESIAHEIVSFRRWQHNLKVLPFIGSTGVGKTFILKVIKNSFHPKNVIYHGDDIDFRTLEAFEFLCDEGNLNAILLDDVSLQQVDELIKVLEFLHTRVKSKLVVIPVFNIHKCVTVINDTRTHSITAEEVAQRFYESKLYYKIQFFKDFDSEDIVNFIKKDLQSLGIPERTYNELIRKFADKYSRQLKCQGLKFERLDKFIRHFKFLKTLNNGNK